LLLVESRSVFDKGKRAGGRLRSGFPGATRLVQGKRWVEGDVGLDGQGSGDDAAIKLPAVLLTVLEVDYFDSFFRLGYFGNRRLVGYRLAEFIGHPVWKLGVSTLDTKPGRLPDATHDQIACKRRS
jgi:hypothetical protein